LRVYLPVPEEKKRPVVSPQGSQVVPQPIVDRTTSLCLCVA
jgi:hypothetical protein